MADREGAPFRVVIAGGGVAGLEGLLALREHAGDRVAVTLLSPNEEFEYRPLSVVEPFRHTPHRRFPLRRITAELDAEFRHTGVAGVDDENGIVRTTAGDEIAYDALLLAIGAKQADAVPGAATFRGSGDVAPIAELLRAAERGEVARIAFAVPDATAWSMGAYDLVLLAAAEARSRGLDGLELHLVTAEARPLGIFGERASATVAELLDEAGVVVHLNSGPVAFENGALVLGGGGAVECDAAVALPVPYVDTLPGLPQQDHRGMIPTDRFCRVLGFDRVFAAGDAIWFPIKQGGLAAQQADCAAIGIAALAGAPVEPEVFHPVLRGALLTGGGPRFMRTDLTGADSTVARAVLWWPPSKIAGRLLAPYLAAKAGFPGEARRALTDLEAPPCDEPGPIETGHEDAVGMALSSATVAAGEHDYPKALRWLEVAEDLELYLPEDYELKRMSWQEIASRPG